MILLSMPGENLSMSLGIEAVYGVTDVVPLGFTSVVSLDVPNKFTLWVPGDVALGINSVVASLFPGVDSLGSHFRVPYEVFFWGYC